MSALDPVQIAALDFARGKKRPPLKRKDPELTRFTEMAAKATTEACIFWPYAKNADGYAVRGLRKHPRGKTRFIHREICEMIHGPAPFHGALVLHACGNGHLGCVNGLHLRWGTHQDNRDDAIFHGTIARGAGNGKAKLTIDQVIEIKLLMGVISQRAIAKKFNISRGAIQSIKRGETWAHVNA